MHIRHNVLVIGNEQMEKSGKLWNHHKMLEFSKSVKIIYLLAAFERKQSDNLFLKALAFDHYYMCVKNPLEPETNKSNNDSLFNYKILPNWFLDRLNYVIPLFKLKARPIESTWWKTLWSEFIWKACAKRNLTSWCLNVIINSWIPNAFF